MSFTSATGVTDAVLISKLPKRLYPGKLFTNLPFWNTSLSVAVFCPLFEPASVTSLPVVGSTIPGLRVTVLAETAWTAPNAARATALVNKTFFIVLSPLFFIIYFS